MNTKLIVLTLAAAPMIALASCREREEPAGAEAPSAGPTLSDIERDAREAANTAGDAFAAEKQRIETRLEQQIAAAKTQLAALRDRAAQASGEAREAFNRSIENLGDSVENAEQRLAELRQSGQSAWDNIKASASGALNDLDAALERTQERLR